MDEVLPAQMRTEAKRLEIVDRPDPEEGLTPPTEGDHGEGVRYP